MAPFKYAQLVFSQISSHAFQTWGAKSLTWVRSSPESFYNERLSIEDFARLAREGKVFHPRIPTLRAARSDMIITRPFLVFLSITLVSFFSLLVFLRHTIWSNLASSVSSAPWVPTEPTWLIWVSSGAHLRQRREIIRSTWQATFSPQIPFTVRFVIGTPSPEWRTVIEQENRTYGDMIVLEGFPDDQEFASTFKPFETFLHMVKNGAGGRRQWDFVTKIDDDSFLNVRRFWEGYIVPNRAEKKKIIGNVVRWARPLDFPSGMMYTLTWDLVQAVARLYQSESHEELLGSMNQVQHEKRTVAETEMVARRGGVLRKDQGNTHHKNVEDLTDPRLSKRHEDFMIADIFVRSNESFEFIHIPKEVAFDVDVTTDGIGFEQPVNVHKLKEDELFLLVAAMYNETGFKGCTGYTADLQARLSQIRPCSIA